MAITKILPRNSGLKAAIEYVLNKNKTQEQILTAHLNCDPGHEYQQMMDTKRELGKLDGRQCYHLIQSFSPREVTPELALEIAREFAQEHLAGYQVVIGTHVDRHHIHSHILFNSVNDETGEKYHCSNEDYYKQIRAVSDRLCKKHGLSIIMQSEDKNSVSYIEWLLKSKGQSTFRSMLEADIKTAIEYANDIGDFLMLMEHMGYEIKHGNRLGFRLRGQKNFMYPERKNAKYSEEGIRASIYKNMDDIDAGLKPACIYREPYRPYKGHPKYTGLIGLYLHYLYVLGKIQKQQHPPRMTAHLKAEVMKFEMYREQFQFLRENNLKTESDVQEFQTGLQSQLQELTKQRTILNVRKKKKKELFDALSSVESLSPVIEFYKNGLSGLEAEYQQYQDAESKLNSCGITKAVLAQQKSELYTELANVNREIRHTRKQVNLCSKILEQTPQMEREIQRIICPPQKRHRRRVYGD